jgi:hypothetical protein
MFDPSMPFTVANGLSAGLDGRDIRTRYTHVLGRTYMAPTVRMTEWHRAKAALALHPPGAVLSHDSVARLLRAPITLGDEEHVTVADDRDRRGCVGLRPHAIALRVCDVGSLRGLPATVPERNFIEMAGRLPLVERVVFGDWLVAQGHTTTKALCAFSAASPARHATWAARAAAYVQPRVGSPRESRLRMLMVLAGLPPPDTGYEHRDPEGELLMQIDMLYRLDGHRAARAARRRGPIGVAVEYDGRDHLATERWERDRVRDDLYHELGFRPIKVTDAGIWRNPDETLLRIHRALSEIGWPGLAPLRDDWRRHFGR